MKKTIYLIILTLCFSNPCYGVWDNDLPSDSQDWNLAAGSIRDNNNALEVELGIDLAEAHPYFQASEPETKPDGTTALDVDDNGRLWVDSDDNNLYVLTAFAGPTWTSMSAAESITASDPTFTLTNTDEEFSDGGGQSRFFGRGGADLAAFGFTEFSHDGIGEDQKGKWRVVLNSGSEGESPSNVPIEYTADGKIKVSTSLSVLDEDDLSSDDDKVVATQQSIKAYIDGQIHHKSFGSRTRTDTGLDAITRDTNYQAESDGILLIWGIDMSGGDSLTIFADAIEGNVTGEGDGARVGYFQLGGSTGSDNAYPNITSAILEDDFVRIITSSDDEIIGIWTPIGTGGLVKQ